MPLKTDHFYASKLEVQIQNYYRATSRHLPSWRLVKKMPWIQGEILMLEFIAIVSLVVSIASLVLAIRQELK